MSFKVVMLATPEIDYYADGTRADWQAYCDRHGYKFHCGREPIIKDMHVVWSKVGLIQEQMRASEEQWIVLVDADTRVNRPDFTLEDLVGRYPGKDVLVSEDCSRRFGAPIPLGIKGPLRMKTIRAANTGFVAIKNNAFGLRFVERWIDLGQNDLASIADVFPREQMIFWVALYREFKPHIAVLGSEVMRVGLSPLLDRLTINTRDAFVLHDKALLEWSGSA